MNLFKPKRDCYRFHDKGLGATAELARLLDAKLYPGGWPQLMNYADQGAAFTHSSSWTTISDICGAQQASIPANSLHVGSVLYIHSWGIVGSAAGSSASTVGLYLNGAAAGTQLSISASATPATATVQCWNSDMWATVQTIGASGTISTAGTIVGISATPATLLLVPATIPTAAVINTTIANSITIAASWVTGAAGNLYTTYGHQVFLVN